MAEKPVTQAFPRRDDDGRVISLAELLAASLLGTVVGLAALALVDAVMWLIGLSSFGRASGWLAVILPALLFFDDLRAWRGHGVRILVGLIGAGIAIGCGLAVAALVSGLPPILSGAVGAAVAVTVYSPIWFRGVRWLTADRS